MTLFPLVTLTFVSMGLMGGIASEELDIINTNSNMVDNRLMEFFGERHRYACRLSYHHTVRYLPEVPNSRCTKVPNRAWMPRRYGARI